MALFKNGVGRPSNELIRKRRTAYLIIAGAILLLIGGGVFYVKKQFSGEIGSKSKNAASSCAQPYNIAACENEGYYERSHGPAIQKLQEMLQEAGYHYGYVNGNYGSNTVDAVKRAQKAYGFAQTGQADYKLVEKMAPKYEYGYTIITYNANGATGKVLGTVDNKEFVMRANTPISTTKLVKNGNTHIGWIATSVSRTNNTPYYYGCDKKNCTKPTMYTEDQKISLGTKFVPYVFTPGEKVHSDTFNGKDGVNVKLSAYFCSATGATYNKNTSSCSKGTAGNGYTYTATFVLNGAKSISAEILGCDVSASNKSEGCKITLPSIVAKPNGTVLGWSKRRYVRGGEFRVGETVTLKKNETYYAITKRTITAKFNKNNAQSIGSTKASCVLYNNEQSCNIITPKITAKSGYAVAGWARNKTGWKTGIFNANSGVHLTGDTTFYALANNLYSRFPDADFRRCVLKSYNSGKREKKIDLSQSEIASIEKLNCIGRTVIYLNGEKELYDIKDVDGISNLTGMISLELSNNRSLKKIDLSKNASLKYLYLNNVLLTSLDVSKNTSLQHLYLDNVPLTSLDVSKNVKLQELSVRAYGTSDGYTKGKLTSLDVSNNLDLRKLFVSDNQLSKLDLSKNSELTSLGVADNKLTELNISKNPELDSLGVGNNQLSKLDLSKNTKLTSISIGKNKLSKLDLSKHTGLTSIILEQNQIKSLNVSKSKKLSYLHIEGNPITELNLTENKLLSNLHLVNTELNNLTLGEKESLVYLYISNCNLKNIYLDKAKSLSNLTLAKMKIENLNIDNNKKLTDLNIRNTNLKEINLSNKTALKSAYVRENKLEKINLTGAVALESLDVYSNKLTILNVSTNKKLKRLQAGGNLLTTVKLNGASSLEDVDLSSNAFSSIDLSDNKKLKILDLDWIANLQKLDVSKNTNLESLSLFRTKLGNLDVSKNSKLKYICIESSTKVNIGNNKSIRVDRR